jgi:hypothetical protein
VSSWGEFADQRPDVAAAGRALLYQHGVGLGFLATTRADGGPRVHPVCPLIDGNGLFVFVVPSPKQGDLRRDGRFALHSFPCSDNEDAFYMTGTAVTVEDAATRQRLATEFVEERAHFKVPAPAAGDVLFRLDLGTCLLTTTAGHGDANPRHTVWRSPGPAE